MILPPTRANIDKAARILKRGGLVAFPTETVYGLGADALDGRAVCRVFAAKKRPSFDPLIVHVATWSQACALWSEVPSAARKLARAFWPGPLTIVLPKRAVVPDAVTAGLPTVAVRMPAHPAARALLKRFGGPIAAPSANRFGRTSPTRARDVVEELGKRADLVLDGGPSTVGVESTVVKIEPGRRGDRGRAVLLRPGGVTLEQLRRVVPVSVARGGRKSQSPGRLASHYAPAAPLFLARGAVRASARPPKGFLWPRIGLLLFNEKKTVPRARRVEILSPRGDLAQAAANLFGAIRRLDRSGVDAIVAERPPRKGLGLAILDRLQKASGGKSWTGRT